MDDDLTNQKKIRAHARTLRTSLGQDVLLFSRRNNNGARPETRDANLSGKEEINHARS